MPQPPEPALRQCSHNLPAGFVNSVISRTLQQKLHSPQAFPGIASMNYSLAMDSDSIVNAFIAEGAGAREIEPPLKNLCSGCRRWQHFSSCLAEQPFDERGDPLPCPRGAPMFGREDRAEAGERALKIVVDKYVIIVRPAADFVARLSETLVDDIRPVLGS